MIVTNCDNALINLGEKIEPTFAYNNAGTGVTKNINDFFTNNNVAGCTLTCNFGDTCGPSTSVTATGLSVTNSVDPWEVTAADNIVAGYTNSIVCMYCSSTFTTNTW